MNCTKCKRDLQADWNFCPDCREATSQTDQLPEMETSLADYQDRFDPDIYDL